MPVARANARTLPRAMERATRTRVGRADSHRVLAGSATIAATLVPLIVMAWLAWLIDAPTRLQHAVLPRRISLAALALTALTGGILGSSQGGDGNVGPGPKTTNVTFGDFSTSITLPSAFGPTLQTFTFTTTTAGNLVFTSVPDGGNLAPYIGNILDNVQVSAVPEPATWLMMLLGFASIGFAAYLRTKRNVVATVG